MAPLSYMNCMSGRGLHIVLAFVIALVGYQPNLGIAAAPVQMLVSTDSDCPNKMVDDCCDKAGKDRRLCLFNDTCVARCHINAGLAVFSFEPVVRVARAELLSVVDLRSRHRPRVGLLFRPPII